MAESSRYQLPPAPSGSVLDVYSSDISDRLGLKPKVAIHLTPSVDVFEADGVTPVLNSVGQQHREPVAAGYGYETDDADTLVALDWRATRFGVVATLEALGLVKTEAEIDALTTARMQAGKGVDWQKAQAVYWLRNTTLAWWDQRWVEYETYQAGVVAGTIDPSEPDHVPVTAPTLEELWEVHGVRVTGAHPYT